MLINLQSLSFVFSVLLYFSYYQITFPFIINFKSDKKKTLFAKWSFYQLQNVRVYSNYKTAKFNNLFNSKFIFVGEMFII